MHTVYFENRCISICQKDNLPSGIRKEQVIVYCGIDSIRTLPEEFAANAKMPDLYLVSEDESVCFAVVARYFCYGGAFDSKCSFNVCLDDCKCDGNVCGLFIVKCNL